jgi:hypothetical protein
MRRYITQLFIITVILALSVAGFARLIDPYGYWGGPTVSGLNGIKPFTSQHAVPVKHQQYLRVQPRTLLVGNSRTEVGMDPESRTWPQAMQPVYNFGLSGAYIGTSVDAAIQASEAHRPDTIIVGVDFLDFRVSQADWQAAWQEPKGLIAPYQTPLSEEISMLFSLDAATQSVATIGEQHKAFPAFTTGQGFNGLNNYNDIVSVEGHAAIFAQRNAEYRTRFLTQKRKLVWPGQGDNAGWIALDRLATYCAARKIKLILYTYPYHTELLQIMDETGLGKERDQWREQLRTYAAHKRVPLSDFIVRDARTAEPVPAKGDTKTHMRYYWEAGHFKAALGDELISAMVR